MARKVTLAQAQAQYPHRFTGDHVPAWALEVRRDGSHYAPQFRSDAEWYAATTFPGEPGLHGNSRHCETGAPTWPLGTSLKAPFHRHMLIPRAA